MSSKVKGYKAEVGEKRITVICVKGETLEALPESLDKIFKEGARVI